MRMKTFAVAAPARRGECVKAKGTLLLTGQDVHHALQAGLATIADVHAELGEIVAGKKLGRESADEIIVFDSTGMALQDVAAAASVYEKAMREGCGITLDFAA